VGGHDQPSKGDDSPRPAVHAGHGAGHHHVDTGTGLFPRDVDGLPEATPTQALDLSDGDPLSLRISPVRKRIGDAVVRMLAYNGSIPGPTLRVRQGSWTSQPQASSCLSISTRALASAARYAWSTC